MTDEALVIKRAQEGDLKAFEELMVKYKKLVYNMCFRMLKDRYDAEDGTQEAFIKIYRGLRAYNGRSKFSTWALKITSNMCIDLIRKRKIQTVPIEDYNIKDDSSPEKHFIDSETKKDINKAVNELPEKYRTVIIYYHFMNLSYAEISDILGEPMSIVKNRIYRARLMLKNKFSERKGGYYELRGSV